MSGYYNKKELEDFLNGYKPYIQEYGRQEPEQKAYDWSPWVGKTLRLLPETAFCNPIEFYRKFFDENGNPTVFKIGDYVYARHEIDFYIEGNKAAKPKKYQICESWVHHGRWTINVMFNGSRTDSQGHCYKSLSPQETIPAEKYIAYLSEHPEYKNIKREAFRLNILLEEE